MAVGYQFPKIGGTADGPDFSAAEQELTIEECCKLGDTLCNRDVPMAERFRALFTLKPVASKHAVEQIARGFSDHSALLKHEVAYVLGQMGLSCAVPLLASVLDDSKQDAMTRHEAGEALGAIADTAAVSALRRSRDAESAPLVVRQTCELAVELIDWRKKQQEQNQSLCDGDTLENCKSPYDAIDPAPCLPFKADAAKYAAIMFDTKNSLFQRYRAMFSLRNLGTPEAVALLAKGFADKSDLFRHEIAYVYGQMRHPDSVPYLAQVLGNESETPMVRHEAAEALGSIATEDCLPLLKRFSEDPNDVVRESCLVGLDMWDYENSAQL